MKYINKTINKKYIKTYLIAFSLIGYVTTSFVQKNVASQKQKDDDWPYDPFIFT